MTEPPATYSSGEIANMLRKSANWFYSHRAELHTAGMPPPIEQPGHPRWPRHPIDAWIAGRKPLAPPANDALAPCAGDTIVPRGGEAASGCASSRHAAAKAGLLPAPEAAAWRPYLAQTYARRALTTAR